MSPKARKRSAKILTLAAALAGLAGACSSSSTKLRVEESAPVALPKVPDYIQVPHPAGTDTGDLRALFQENGAPTLESLESCNADQAKLWAATPIEDERTQGMRELVRENPVGYHWCYYGKLLNLENRLRAESYVDERQKAVLEAFAFLTPVARAFMAEFRDTRYLRWGVAYYRRTSEWVFFRKLELSPQGTSELVEAATPFGLYRDPAAPRPVLDRYRIAGRPVAPAPSPSSSPAPAVAAESAESPPPPSEAVAAIEDDAKSEVEGEEANEVESREPASVPATVLPAEDPPAVAPLK